MLWWCIGLLCITVFFFLIALLKLLSHSTMTRIRNLLSVYMWVCSCFRNCFYGVVPNILFLSVDPSLSLKFKISITNKIVMRCALLKFSLLCIQFSSVSQSCPTLCDPMNRSTPGLPVHPNPCPSSWWCHPTISSSVVPFSSCLQSFPASGSFPVSQLFASGGQSIGVSASTSVLPMNTQDWSPLGWTGWISLQSKGLSRIFSNTTVQNHQFFSAQLSL